MTADQVLEKAAEIIADKFVGGDMFTAAKASKEYLTFKLANYEKKVFAVMLLNTQHQLIEYR